MIDILSGGILGSLIGGLFRLAPEVLKYLNGKSERAHELEMFDRQCQLELQKGSQKLQEIGAEADKSINTAIIGALNSAITSQAEMVQKAPRWVAGLSASVRPVVTYSLIGTYLILQLGMAIYAGSVEAAYKTVITPDFVALVSGTLNYWFMSRTLEKRGLA